jgi:hypothetical protein
MGSRTGAELTSYLLQSAAEGGRLAVMKYLNSQGCDWGDVLGVCVHAALGGSVDALAYAFDQKANHIVIEQDEEQVWLGMLLNAAGGNDKLEAAKWLRQQGAEWPNVLRFTIQYDEGGEKVYKWEHNALQWARAEGCTSPTTKPPTGNTA